MACQKPGAQVRLRHRAVRGTRSSLGWQAGTLWFQSLRLRKMRGLHSVAAGAPRRPRRQERRILARCRPARAGPAERETRMAATPVRLFATCRVLGLRGGRRVQNKPDTLYGSHETHPPSSRGRGGRWGQPRGGGRLHPGRFPVDPLGVTAHRASKPGQEARPSPAISAARAWHGSARLPEGRVPHRLETAPGIRNRRCRAGRPSSPVSGRGWRQRRKGIPPHALPFLHAA